MLCISFSHSKTFLCSHKRWAVFFNRKSIFGPLWGIIILKKTDIVSISNRTEGATRDNQLNQISLSRFLFRVKRLKSTLAPSNGGGRVRGPGPFTLFFLKCNFFWWGINFQANQPFHFYLNFSLLKPMLYVLARYPCYKCQFITGETISRAICDFLVSLASSELWLDMYIPVVCKQKRMNNSHHLRFMKRVFN